MNTKRDKFLTEVMGKCWHEEVHECCVNGELKMVCKCGIYAQKGYHDILSSGFKQTYDFSTWDGYGKLWEWVQGQKWFGDFMWRCEPFRITHECLSGPPMKIWNIHPSAFATSVYNYLKDKS